MSLSDLTILLMMMERERREREWREERERFELMAIRDGLRERLAVQQQQYLQQQQQCYGTFDYARGQRDGARAAVLLCDDDGQKHEVRALPRTMKCPGCDGVGSAWRVSRSYFRSHTYDTCAQCRGRGTLEVSLESPKLVARKSVFTFSF
jgi:hypothetical protein